MATLPDIWQSLRTSFQGALNGIVDTDRIYIDTPSAHVLETLASVDSPLVHIFDLRMGKDSTRWVQPIRLTPVVTPATLVSTLSAPYLSPGAPETLTLSGTPGVGDVVSMMLSTGTIFRSTLALSVQGSTLDSIAADLAARINASSLVNGWVHATAAGPVVTLANISPNNFKLYSLTGNSGRQVTEVGRVMRLIGVTLWTGSEAKREQIGPLMMAHIMNLQRRFGLKEADGTATRIKYNYDMPGRDDKNSNIYRWDFGLEAEFGVTNVDNVATVLGAQITKVVGY